MQALPKAALGGGDMWGAFNDRDATKVVAEYMLSVQILRQYPAAQVPNNC
jgi:hypothetical protein